MTRRHMTHRRHLSLHQSHGQTASEYAILLALVFVVVAGVIPLFGANVVGLFTQALTQLTSAFGG
jgi:Flp pilus assembly pilin Flp